MTPVGEVFLAIFLTLCFFAALVAFCKYFCKNTPITCECCLLIFPFARADRRARVAVSLTAHECSLAQPEEFDASVP